MIFMPAFHKQALFIFRRDLRLYDNIALMQALQDSASVIPCFIFTPEQIESNSYRSDHCLAFMIESIEDLYQQLNKKLYLFQGEPDKIVDQCIRKLNIDAVYANRDYTPYSTKRDKQIESVCRKHGIEFHRFDDALLHPPEETLKADGKPYSIFSPYFRNASTIKVPKPQINRSDRYFTGPISFAKTPRILDQIRPETSSKCLKGGRTEGLKLLKKIGDFSNYNAIRDLPWKSTTHLSPYLKFNVLSIREVFRQIASKLGPHHELIRSLMWRDFFTSIAFFFPHVFKGAFRAKFDRIRWKHDKKAFQKWCQGKTGVPIVDAGMRELNESGFMHNRVRMIAASFLVKDLHIDWRWGEKYFARKLIDYDPAVNNGNWQWVAGTGCDAQPYFRIFNPWNQQKKFDPDCLYIKKWVPELRVFSSREIHQWAGSKDYPPPIADHAKETPKALRAYRVLN